MSPRSTPRSIGDTVRALRAEVEPATPLAAVQSHWAAAVGERIAAEARPVAERDGCVTVECRSATWAQELDLLQGDVIERLNRRLSEPRVRRLRTIVGPAADPGTF